MLRHILQKILILSLILAPLTPAYAQDKSQDKTALLQSMFSRILEDQTQKLATSKTPATLIQEGPIDIEKTGEYYAITLPQLSMNYPNGHKIRIGMISINANPAENPGEWKMTLAIPTPIIGYDTANRETMRIDMAAQKMAGIWNEDLKTFTKLDATYKNIDVNFPDNGGHITLPDFLVRYDLDMVDKGLWSGPLYLRALNTKWSLPLLRNQGTIEKIGILLTFDQFSQNLFHDALNKPLQTLSLSNPALWSAAKNLKSEWSIEKLSQQTQKQDRTTQTITLAKTNANIALDRDETGAHLNALIKGTFEGLNISGGPIEFNELIPERGAINITHKNIPVHNLTKAFENGGLNTPMAMLKISTLLAQAKSTIESENSYIANKNYNLNLSAIMLADMAATNTATAQGRLTFEGLDKVLSISQVNGSTSRQSPYAQPFRNFSGFLERAKTWGRVETNSNQSFVHIYDFKMNESGAFTINDQNAADLFLGALFSTGSVQTSP